MATCEVLVSGCFNLCHPGHVQLLEFASRFGQVTVGLNNDPYLQKKYGDKAIPLIHRAYVMNAIRYVDNVVSFSEEEPSALIRKLRPRYYVRGPDYSGKALPEQAALDDIGTQLIVHTTDKIFNSSELIQQKPVLDQLSKWF